MSTIKLPSGPGSEMTEIGQLNAALAAGDAAEVNRLLRTATPSQASSLLNWLPSALEPCPPREAVILLTECLKAMSGGGGRDFAASLRALVTDLGHFPRDVLQTAISDWRRNKIFWPSSAELIPECKNYMATRTATLRSLRAGKGLPKWPKMDEKRGRT